MSADSIEPAPDPVRQVAAYIASLRSALGARDPFTVLHEAPGELRRATVGLPPPILNAPEAPGKWSIRDVCSTWPTRNWSAPIAFE